MNLLNIAISDPGDINTDSDLVRMFTGDRNENDELIYRDRPDSIECLDEALRLLHLAESQEGKICTFNISKCLYEKVNCIMDSYGT